MADNNNNNNQQKGGGNKATSGINVSTTIAPEDVTNREKLSGLFTTLAFGALAMLGMAHVAPIVRTKLFRCKGEAPKTIDKNEVFNFARSDQPTGLKVSLAQSIFNSLDDEGKAKFAAISGGSAPKQVVEVNVNEAAPAPAQVPAKTEQPKPAKNDKGNGKK